MNGVSTGSEGGGMVDAGGDTSVPVHVFLGVISLRLSSLSVWFIGVRNSCFRYFSFNGVSCYVRQRLARLIRRFNDNYIRHCGVQ